MKLDIILVIGIAVWALSYDSASIELESNLQELWKLGDGDVKGRELSDIIKYSLALVLLVRAYTSKLFLTMYILMFVPAISEYYPHLLIPWLFVGFLRSLLLTVITLCVGCYVCFVRKGVHAICLDFIIAQCIDHGPPICVWFFILNFYHELKNPKPQTTKSQIMQTIDNFTDNTLTNIMSHLRPFVIPTRSLDTLLSNKESGLTKQETQENCNLLDYAKRVLEISDEDILKIKQSKVSDKLKYNSNKGISPIEEEKELVCLTLNDKEV